MQSRHDRLDKKESHEQTEARLEHSRGQLAAESPEGRQDKLQLATGTCETLENAARINKLKTQESPEKRQPRLPRMSANLHERLTHGRTCFLP